MNKEAKVVKRGEGDVMSVLGTSVRFLLEGERTGRAFSLMEVELPKDQGPPPHDHPWDEAYYIIDGDVWFMVDGAETVYSAGDFVYAPGGVLHSFKGAGDVPARVLVMDAPATAELFFRDVNDEVKVLPDDLAKVPGIGARHQLRFVAPGA